MTIHANAPAPSTCEHARMVDGVYRVIATPLGVSAEPVVAERPARQCARCGWVNGRMPGIDLTPGFPHQIRVGFVPNPRKDRP